MKRILLALAILIAATFGARAQTSVFVVGPVVPGDCVKFVSTTGLADAGSTCSSGGGGTPGGVNGSIQYNNSGSFGGYTVAQLAVLLAPFGPVPGGASGSIQYNNGGVFGGYTLAQLTALIAPFGSPGGRLTTSSGVCNQTADVVAATAIYYAPCINTYVPIYNGTNLQGYNFTSSPSDTTGLTLTLGSNWSANTLYDVYASVSGGAPVLCTIPWSSTGYGTSTRTSGLVVYYGILTNSSPASCRTTNSATLSMSANQGTYLGTFLTNGSAGQIDLKFGTLASGGGAAIQSIWNTYNQILGTFFVQDTATGFNPTASTTTQPYNAGGTGGGVGNRVTVVQGSTGTGLSLSFSAFSTTVSANTAIGFGWNSTTAFSSRCTTALGGGSASFPLNSNCSVYASAGLNYVQALQWASAAASVAFQNTLGSEGLTAAIWW